jgi:hypothetical protein
MEKDPQRVTINFADPATAYAYQIGEAINYATRFDNREKRDELHAKLMDVIHAQNAKS